MKRVWRKQYAIRAPEETTPRTTIYTYPGPWRQVPTHNMLPLFTSRSLFRGAQSTSRYHAAQMLRFYRQAGYVITTTVEVG